METCPICRFNISLYNHMIALFFFINWCICPITSLACVIDHKPIYFNSIFMALTTTLYILPLIYILKFYLFRTRDSKVDNNSQYDDSVVTNCELN